MNIRNFFLEEHEHASETACDMWLLVMPEDFPGVKIDPARQKVSAQRSHVGDLSFSWTCVDDVVAAPRAFLCICGA